MLAHGETTRQTLHFRIEAQAPETDRVGMEDEEAQIPILAGILDGLERDCTLGTLRIGDIWVGKKWIQGYPSGPFQWSFGTRS